MYANEHTQYKQENIEANSADEARMIADANDWSFYDIAESWHYEVIKTED